MTELAVIGIDSLLANHNSIDRVERALYQGAALNQSKLTDKINLSELCVSSVERMTLANQLQPSDISLVVVDSAAAQLQVDDKFVSCSIFSNLSDAMTESHRLISESWSSGRYFLWFIKSSNTIT